MAELTQAEAIDLLGLSRSPTFRLSRCFPAWGADLAALHPAAIGQFFNGGLPAATPSPSPCPCQSMYC